MAKTYDERIAEAKQKIEQEQNRMKRLIQEQKTAERKARTKRLIERGAILESLIDGAEGMTNEEVKAVLQTALSPVPAVRNPQISTEQPQGEDSLV